MSDYKPTANNGLRKDGQPDGRVKSSADGTSERDSESPDSSSTVNSGNQPESIYKPSEHDGLKKDGTPDKRVNPEHGFGGRPHEEVVEAARAGGKASGGESKQTDEEYVE